MNINKNIIKIIKTLNDNNYQAYLVGGCVRDYLLNKQPNDYDIVTNAKPNEIINLFDKTIPVGEQFGVVVVVLNNEEFEIATFRLDCEYADGRHPKKVNFTNDPKEDATRRDFTINGLFYDINKNEILDFVDGQKDLDNKIIKAIGHPYDRFEEDKLRMLRAIRFAAKYGFKIERNTYNDIFILKDKIVQVSKERIREEISKMLLCGNARYAFELLKDTGLLEILLFDVYVMAGT